MDADPNLPRKLKENLKYLESTIFISIFYLPATYAIYLKMMDLTFNPKL